MAGACDVNQASQSKSTKPSHTALPPGKDFIKDLFAFSSSQRLSQKFHISPPLTEHNVTFTSKSLRGEIEHVFSKNPAIHMF